MGAGFVTLAAGDTLVQNPFLGGSVLAAALGFMVWLVRQFLRSDGRWERLSDAQQRSLDAALARAQSAETRAAAAEVRAFAAEVAAQQLRSDVEHMRGALDRSTGDRHGTHHERPDDDHHADGVHDDAGTDGQH